MDQGFCKQRYCRLGDLISADLIALVVPLKYHRHQTADGKSHSNALQIRRPGKDLAGHQLFLLGQHGGPFDYDTAEAAALQRLQQIPVGVPEQEELLQIPQGAAAGTAQTGGVELQHGVIQQGKQRTVFSGKITVKCFSGHLLPLAQGVGPAVALVIMNGLGYVNNAVDPATGAAMIDVTLLSWDVAINLRTLVAALFLVSAVMQFVGLALVYNLDKKTLEKMNAELAERHSAE